MRTFTRRAIPALALGAAACATPVAARGQSLHALAAAKGMRFGAAMPHRALGDGLYLDLLRSECGLIVSENEHKWAAIQPAQGGFQFRAGGRDDGVGGGKWPCLSRAHLGLASCAMAAALGE
ncbi:MAG: endo-1,4-beta-xylanase [Terricaulis sp.]|nr:endo-1,4-beta-xylanase [Terricaulis sp.]